MGDFISEEITAKFGGILMKLNRYRETGFFSIILTDR
jgi:hypothetical protein